MEVPVACASLAPEVDIHPTALAWELTADGDRAQHVRTSSLVRHPVDSHATASVTTGDGLLLTGDVDAGAASGAR
jgi:hypothetical protein